ncbi:hypothetical protein [Pseudomonas extremorientalis]|uniref:hypothetical protein n=1 Tax=Pseudomonas TaxID=286 RepID=UPI00273622D0|nr:hypothetical protein [Pseudomonas extremorientalis]WLG54001.1 hypothetical protein PSH77_14970 [Pseudomonas extremorientalis]
MHPGQTIFPYVLITNDPEVIAKAVDISVNGVAEARGIVTFMTTLGFEDTMSALNADGGEVGLIQAYDSQFKGAAGDIVRLFTGLTRATPPARP